uniref:17 kDa surface antigen n=1 Tax=Caulobacter sp. (strain K31) TaxID=366602 RepID=B0T7U6_CAUSK
MMFKTVLGLTAAAALAGVLAPTIASAQAYGAYGNSGAYNGSGGSYNGNGYYYDPCRRSTTQRGTGGGLAGAGIGAAIGSGVSGHGARTEGAVLGGLLGAVIGSNIGKNSAACTPGATPPPPTYNQGAYNQPYDNLGQGYDDPDYSDSRYGDRRDGYTYESERSYSVTQDRGRADANGCTLAESPIYLPDGRTQKRFVRVCPDAQGHYQVVD